MNIRKMPVPRSAQSEVLKAGVSRGRHPATLAAITAATDKKLRLSAIRKRRRKFKSPPAQPRRALLHRAPVVEPGDASAGVIGRGGSVPEPAAVFQIGGDPRGACPFT